MNIQYKKKTVKHTKVCANIQNMQPVMILGVSVVVGIAVPIWETWCTVKRLEARQKRIMSLLNMADIAIDMRSE
jgi:hypothetical protein